LLFLIWINCFKHLIVQPGHYALCTTNIDYKGKWTRVIYFYISQKIPWYYCRHWSLQEQSLNFETLLQQWLQKKNKPYYYKKHKTKPCTVSHHQLLQGFRLCFLSCSHPPLVLEKDTTRLGRKHSKKFQGLWATLSDVCLAKTDLKSLQLIWGIKAFCFRKSHILVKCVSWKSMLWVLFPFPISHQQNNDKRIKEMKPKDLSMWRLRKESFWTVPQRAF